VSTAIGTGIACLALTFGFWFLLEFPLVYCIGGGLVSWVVLYLVYHEKPSDLEFPETKGADRAEIIKAIKNGVQNAERIRVLADNKGFSRIQRSHVLDLAALADQIMETFKQDPRSILQTNFDTYTLTETVKILENFLAVNANYRGMDKDAKRALDMFPETLAHMKGVFEAQRDQLLRGDVIGLYVDQNVFVEMANRKGVNGE
jgi:hypothetical protein